MNDWVLVPCLVALRREYDAVAPSRDKGSDGSIGDSAHTSSSDHTPDEDSDVLRDHDADHKNEVHALDIDSTGPWPGGWSWFNGSVVELVERHRRGLDNRLKYVIWNGKIASKSDGWKWKTYTATSDKHTGHVHFSAVYTTVQENDTSPWGVSEEIEMELDTAITLTRDTKKALGTESPTMNVGILLQTIAIWAARSAKSSSEILGRLDIVTSDTATAKEKADALEVLLGADSVEVGKLLAS